MTKPHTQPCSLAAALNIFGDAWTLIVVREALYGVTRYSDFRRATGMAKNILSDRLQTLVAEGILETRPIGPSGRRFEYHLTEKGWALIPSMVAIIQWADRWVYGEGGEPLLFTHAETGERAPELIAAWSNGAPLRREDIRLQPGPGANDAIRKRFGSTSSDDEG